MPVDLDGLFQEGIAEGRALERERCARIADTEPECPGEMPHELHLVPIEDALRAAVRATKKSIAATIRSGK